MTFLLFLGWLSLAVIIGLVRMNAAGTIYTDANAFLYLGLLPAWWILIRKDAAWRSHILGLLLAGATVIGLKSWLLVLFFGHNVSNIREVYSWVRNTGVGEITLINNNVFRVFFQSQIYSLFALCLLLAAWVRDKIPGWTLLPMIGSALGVYISLSRSLWLGLAGTIVLIITWQVWYHQAKKLSRLFIIVPLGLTAWAMTVWAVSFPAWRLSGGGGASVIARLQGPGANSASTARINQIRPLFQEIADHPILGSGFGTTVTYFSTDPTIHGWRTTTAFELGYLDLWLKLGLLGITLYAVWIWQMWHRLVRRPWGIYFVAGTAALLVTHLTSPYLNHPLGLGWLMMLSLYAHDPG